MKKFLTVVLEMTMNPLTKITFSCKRMARHGIAFPFRAVIGLAALSLLNCVAFGQPFSGPGVFSGNTQFGAPVGGGAPLTYAAVTDQCELGTETYCASGLPLPFLYCNTGAYSPGSTFTPVNTAPCPVANGGTAPNIGGLTGAGTIITEPYFNSKVVRVTDNATQSASPNCPGGIYDNFSDGQNNGWSSDSSKFVLENVSTVKCIFAFSADSSMTVAPSSISGTSGTACSTNCTQFLTGASVTFDLSDSNKMIEASSTGALNSLTISACSPSRATCTTHVAPTVANAANWIFSRTKIFNFLTDCSGPCGLPSAFVPSWTGVVAVSDDGSTISFALSDDGQNSPNWSDGTHMCPQPAGTTVTKYGPSFIFAYKIGSGWRTYNTCGFLGINGDVPYIQGSFGDTGSPTDGTCSGGGCPADGMQPVGTSGGSAITDFMSLHDSQQVSDSRYVTLAAIASDSTLPGSCSGHVCINQPYFWEVATTNVRYSTCNAHAIKGFKYLYGGHYYTACGYHNPNTATPPNGLNLLATGFAIDQHGFSNNMGVDDYQPGGGSTVNVCDQSGTPGGSPTGTFPTGPCKTYATDPWWGEIDMVENSIGNYTNAANAFGKHCNYGNGVNGDSCVYRMGQTYNTGTSPYFSTQNAIANNDPTGRYALFVSDWWRTLGCSNGVSSGCLDPVSAGNSATTPTISAVAVDSAGTIATITVANTSPVISTGMDPSFSGLGNATFLNGNYYFVKSFSGTQFTVCVEAAGAAGVCTVGGIGHASYSGAETTGTATWGSCTSRYAYASCPRSDLFVMDLVSAHPTPPSSGPLWAGILDPNRAIDWTNAGVQGGIPSATWTKSGSTIAAGASTTTIQNALDACGTNHYVLLGAGTFGGLSGLNIPSDCVLRGSGADQTFLVFSNNTGCSGAFSVICFAGAGNYFASSEMQPGGANAATWSSGYAKGTTQIVLNNIGSNGISVGKYIVLDMAADTATNSGYFICENLGVCSAESGATNYSRMVGGVARWITQIVQVTGCTPSCTNGSTFTISPGVYAPNVTSGRTPGVWWPSSFITNAGIENLSIDSTSSGDLNSLTTFNAADIWFRGIRVIRSSDSSRSMIHIVESAHVTVQDSYLFEGPSAHSQNYGIEQLVSSDVLVLNNIFQAIVVPNLLHATVGGVWAYNYCINNRFDAGMSPCMGGHSGGVTYNLFEGNIAQKIGGDNTHGTGPMNTAFRNYFLGTDTGQTNATNAEYSSAFTGRYWNYVGNVLGTPGYHNAYQTGSNTSIYALGNTEGGTPDDSTLSYSTSMRWGNYDTVTGGVRFDTTEDGHTAPTYPAINGASQTFPASFYYSSQPSWWPGGKAWPPIGPDVTTGTLTAGSGGGIHLGNHVFSIPARDCYLNVMGGPADGSGSSLTFNASTCYP